MWLKITHIVPVIILDAPIAPVFFSAAQGEASFYVDLQKINRGGGVR